MAVEAGISAPQGVSGRFGESVYFLGRVPTGYKKSLTEHLPAVQATEDGFFRDSDDIVMPHSAECSIFDAKQINRWKEATGLQPQDSKFTLTMPIHNEETVLSDSLAALLFSDIPNQVQLNVVLVTNACTDKSPTIVQQFIGTLGEVQEGTLDSRLLEDSGLDTNYHYVQLDTSNIKFIHINTKTAGQANALTLGSRLAEEAGHRIALSIDADSFPEPDAIPNLFGSAHREIVEKTNGAAVLSGNYKPANQRRTLYRKIKGRLTGFGMREGVELDEYKQPPPGHVTGAMMAWDTDFVGKLGGIPPVILNDYALSLAARKAGRTPIQVKDAKFWTYQEASLSDQLKTKSRYIKGYLQLMDQGEFERQTVPHDYLILGSLPTRLRYYFDDSVYNNHLTPTSFMGFLGRTFLSEYARFKGFRDYKRNPDGQTWVPSSTKNSA